MTIGIWHDRRKLTLIIHRCNMKSLSKVIWRFNGFSFGFNVHFQVHQSKSRYYHHNRTVTENCNTKLFIGTLIQIWYQVVSSLWKKVTSLSLANNFQGIFLIQNSTRTSLSCHFRYRSENRWSEPKVRGQRNHFSFKIHSQKL